MSDWGFVFVSSVGSPPLWGVYESVCSTKMSNEVAGALFRYRSSTVSSICVYCKFAFQQTDGPKRLSRASRDFPKSYVKDVFSKIVVYMGCMQSRWIFGGRYRQQ